MYSLRYGTPPVVHEVGGLADTVVDCREASLADGSANGFTFHEATVEAMLAALRRAVDAWCNRALWRRLQRAGMQAEHGWEAAARQYLALYQELTSRS
jgi:starch synthase